MGCRQRGAHAGDLGGVSLWPLTGLPPLPPPPPTVLLLLGPSFAGWGQAAVAPVAWSIRHDHGGVLEGFPQEGRLWAPPLFLAEAPAGRAVSLLARVP